MKITKRIISIVMALFMLVTTLAVVASVSASAEDQAVYFMKFTNDNFAGWGSYSTDITPTTAAGQTTIAGSTTAVPLTTISTVEGPITYNNGGSFTMSSNGYILGQKAMFNLDSTAKSVFANAAANTAAGSYVAMTYQAYLAKSTTETGLKQDSQVIIYLIGNDGTETKLSTTFIDHARTVSVNVEFKTTVNDVSTAITSLDGYKGIAIEMYHWVKMEREVTVSGFVIKGTGIPSMPALDPIVVEDGVTTATMWKFDANYKMDYSNGPDKYIWNKDTLGNYDGSVTFKCINDGPKQRQAYFKYDRDVANYALAVAQKEGNSGYAQMTVKLDTNVDNNGKSVAAEINIQFVIDGVYTDMVKAWQDPGTTETYYMDVSNIARGSLIGVKICAQNYGYYDASGNLVVLNNEDKLYYDTKGNLVNNGPYTAIPFIMPRVTFSAITVSSVGGETPTKTVATTATESTSAAITTIGEIKPGDVDGNGSINSKDSLQLKRFLANYGNPINMFAADTTGDGTINSKDSLLLKKFLANWEVVLG